MKKNILVVYYTQSGQLREIADSLTQPFRDPAEYQITWHRIEPEEDFPFPWTGESFFESFPDSFQQRPHRLKPVPAEILEGEYDLVIFHYQVWFLSPSVPVTSFLKSADGRKLLSGRPVITVSGTRNMWILTQEKIKKLLQEAGANLVGNVALVDRAGNLVSVITIVDWMFSGIKRKVLGIFPMPGVSEEDIRGAERFGTIIRKHLEAGSLDTLQPELVANGAVRISSFLLSVDRKGNAIFKKWAQIIDKQPAQRKLLLKLFNLYVLLALYVVSPIVFVFHILTYPFWRRSFLREREYFQSV